ncbi:HD domain-containing protein [Novosphingobium album (ex Hu et al. 2023)]|uniref:HD domain-containing protein n=1 Tax=Novosphingobium album (ex Hu et al. 2023) TaxID=2930093 RepID=A0ABT0AWH7_9SPHN|nr:HD domain-containing protein [Novosphingobium album (ex Hu et al. 2023)]MCJ2177191.1 HD domain-containing protein [Novosphingobium album (ex Hu et al. 2023)]
MTSTFIDSVFALFDKFGSEHYGEDASQLQHALQCAQLARQHGCSDSLIAASLLHDIGQFLDDAGNAAVKLHTDGQHETTGASYLSAVFGPEVTEPVRLHVDAKRYLCTMQPDYRDGLSGASQLSLELQGGTMSDEEAESFLANRYAKAALLLRSFDDAGKRPDWQVPGLDTYRAMLQSLQRAS